MLNRRGLILLGTVALLAGCKVIPKGEPQRPPPPTDNLPSDGERHRIALLVPLTGPASPLGQSLANATTMALLDTNAKTVRITTYDTTPGPAAAARDAIRDGNRLILGPLQPEAVGPIATVARAARVPVITFANDAGVAGRDVFVMGTVPSESIRRVTEYARGRGLTRFALLVPEGDYGNRARSAMTEAVRGVGGTLVGSESYDRGNTSVISAARRLRAKAKFDAVLVADGVRISVLAAPQLKAPGTRLLGTDLWSGEAALGKSAALRGAWFAALSDARFRQFSDSYRARFGAAPLRAATMGYDAVLLTVRIARDWRSGTPFPTARLSDSGGFLGLDGPFRFGPNGVIERALEVREARAGSVAVISAAPEKFVD